VRYYQTEYDFYLLDRKLAIIERYRRKVIPAIKRARGNPQNLRYAVAWIKGWEPEQIICECCGSTKRVQLHHRNGIWKDYYVHNLVFVCAVCHLDQHNGCWSNRNHLQEEDIMAVINRTNWNHVENGESMRVKFIRLVADEMKLNGGIVSAACRKLSEDSQKLFGNTSSANGLESIWYATKARKASASVDNKKKTPKPPTDKTPTVLASVRGMDMQAFMREALRDGYNITIISK